MRLGQQLASSSLQKTVMFSLILGLEAESHAAQSIF